MSIMVTGGAGFIGARIVRKLVERGQQVVCFDLMTPKSNLAQYMDSIEIYRGDVTQLPQLLEAVTNYGVTRIIHLAALLPPDSEERPHFAMHVNILGSNNVFEVARWSGLVRVVYASSISCYGTQEGFGDRPVDETDNSNPVNVYGMTKAANDFAASKYIEKYGVDLRGIRICTVFGHGRITGMTGLIGGLLMSNPAVGKPLDMPFDPSEASTMIYVEDAAEIFVQAALSESLRHPVYITGGHLATLGEMADIVRTYLPGCHLTMGKHHIPHVHKVDNSLMLQDIGYEIPPLKKRILDHINEARLELGLVLIEDHQ